MSEHLRPGRDSAEKSLQKINALLSVSGGAYIGSTAAVNGQFSAVQVLTETKFHTLTGNVTGVANTTAESAPAIPAGTIIYGSFTTIQLHSGSVIAYAQ
jgi:hypothetical protein